MLDNSFLGIQLGSNGFKLQQIVMDEDCKPVSKTSDILFWVAFNMGNGILYVPVSRLDMEYNTILVPSQLLRSAHDRTRNLSRKTDKGIATYPFSVILRK